MARPKKPTATAYFAPGQNAGQVLVDAIGRARQSILVFAHTLTAVPVAMALEAAHARGVLVRILLSPAEEQNPASQLGPLYNAGIPVKIDDQHLFVHERTLVLDGHTVITGNYHYAGGADEHYAASFVVIANARHLAAQYRGHFEEHAHHSRHPHSYRPHVRLAA